MKSVSKILFIVILFLQFTNSFVLTGQSWEWGAQFSGNGNVKPVDIARDASDNLFIAGTYDTDAMTAGSDQLDLAGSTDVFVSSFTATGSYRWSARIAGTGTDDVKAIAVDETGSVYVVGGFKDATVYFTPTDSLDN